MRQIWFISDTHFGHENILTFKDDAGNLIRPGFSSVEEMDERMIANWNSVVKDGDHVWHLGDVALGGGKPNLASVMSRLKGRKRVTVGNHDHIADLVPVFKKVELWRNFKEFNFTCTHIPLRLDQLRKTKFNVHGHIHQNMIVEPQYINVCVERNNYTPVSLEEILERIKNAPCPE